MNSREVKGRKEGRRRCGSQINGSSSKNGEIAQQPDTSAGKLERDISNKELNKWRNHFQIVVVLGVVVRYLFAYLLK